MPFIVCDYCGKVFWRVPSNVSKYSNRRNYCSVECVAKAKSEEQTGIPKKWIPEKILLELRTLYKKLGHPPTDTEIKKENYKLYKAILQWFGNVNNARRAAGIPVNVEHERWSNEKIKREYIKLMNELGRIPTSRDLEKYNNKLRKAIETHYGSLKKLRRELGLPEVVERKPRKKVKESAYEISKELAYIVGVLLGDGSLIYTRTKRFCLRTIDWDFAIYTYAMLKEWCGIEPKIYEIKGGERLFPNGVLSKTKNSFVVALHSKEAVEILKRYSEDYSWIFDQPEDFRIAFIKGLWDSEGTITDPYTISWCNTNKKLVETYAKLLASVGIKARIFKRPDRELYDVKIFRKKDVIKFYKKIGITIKRKRDKLLKALPILYRG